MKRIPVNQAIGSVLCHDMTRIVRDELKEVAFSKGHVIREEDIEKLLSMGKDHIYVYEMEEGMVHEDDAAERLLKICMNDHMKRTSVKEGKVELVAAAEGFFQVDRNRLAQINVLGDMMIATRMGNLPIQIGDKLAGMRVIPLLVREEKLMQAENIYDGKPLLSITPFRHIKAGIVTTGNEVYYKRIVDRFTPVIEEKLERYHVGLVGEEICYDDIDLIKKSILSLKEKGADLIVCTGGMSVDPDDLTPAAIKHSGAGIVSYGSPVLPGAMFLLAYFEDGTAVMGVPGCAMYNKTTVFDIVLPYVLAGVQLDQAHLAELGYGGLCLNCQSCHYPNCMLGKGV